MLTEGVMSPVDAVRSMIAAENDGDRALLDSLLSDDFTAITRSGGAEHGRPDFLAGIGAPSPAEPWRSIERASVDVEESADLAVARTIVSVTSRADHTSIGRFRNLFVLRRTGGRWRCVTWQVTRLEELASDIAGPAASRGPRTASS